MIKAVKEKLFFASNPSGQITVLLQSRLTRIGGFYG